MKKSNLSLSARLLALVMPVATLGIALSLSSCSERDEYVEAKRNQPTLVVGAVVDITGSFQPYQAPAADLLQQFVLKNATEGNAQVLLFSMASQTHYLKQITPGRFISDEAMTALEEAKKPGVGIGTDVVTAIEQAATRLRERDANRKVLLVFSDAVVDATKENGKVKEFRRLSEMDWRQLQGIEVWFCYVDVQAKREILEATKGLGLKVQVKEPAEMDSNTIEQIVEGGMK